MKWKCPHCEEEIEELYYSVNTVGTEYGTAYLNNKPKPTITENERPAYYQEIADYERDDDNTSEWDGSPEYRCRECDEDIELDELIPIITKEDTKTEEKLEEPEETLHNIIKPKNLISTNQVSRDASQYSLTCKKCLYLFIHGIEPYSHNETEDLVECPLCGQLNSLKAFKETLNKDE